MNNNDISDIINEVNYIIDNDLAERRLLINIPIEYKKNYDALKENKDNISKYITELIQNYNMESENIGNKADIQSCTTRAEMMRQLSSYITIRINIPKPYQAKVDKAISKNGKDIFAKIIMEFLDKWD